MDRAGTMGMVIRIRTLVWMRTMASADPHAPADPDTGPGTGGTSGVRPMDPINPQIRVSLFSLPPVQPATAAKAAAATPAAEQSPAPAIDSSALVDGFLKACKAKGGIQLDGEHDVEMGGMLAKLLDEQLAEQLAKRQRAA